MLKFVTHRTSNLIGHVSHPVSKEDQMYLICVPGSCFIHMEDVISEYIKDNVQQRKQKRNKYFITHSDNRHEGLNISPTTYTRSLTELPTGT